MKTTLFITEECTYKIEVEGDTYTAMKEFLRDPNKHLTAITERDVDVQVDGQYLEDDDEIAAQDEIVRAEMDS